MSMYRYIEQKYREETPQQVNATADGGNDTTPSATTTQDIEARYGLFPYGNEVGFTKLNEMMDADDLDSQQRYDIQQKWFKNQENYINSLPEAERAEWNKVLDEIKASDKTMLQNTVANTASTAGSRFAAAGAEMDAAVTRSTNAVFTEVNDEDRKQARTLMGKKNSKLAQHHDKIMAAVQNDQTTLDTDAYMAFGADNEVTALAKELGVSKEELKEYANIYEKEVINFKDNRSWKEYNAKNRVTYTRKELEALKVPTNVLDGKTFDTNANGEYLLTQDQEAQIKRRAAEKETDRLAGYNERKQQQQKAGLWENVTSMNFADAMDYLIQGGESTISQAPELLAQMGIAAATGGMSMGMQMTLQVLGTSLTNSRLDTREAFMNTLKERAKDKGLDLAYISESDFQSLIDEVTRDGSLGKELRDTEFGSIARSAAELVSTGSTEALAHALKKFGNNQKGMRGFALKVLAETTAFLGEPTGEINGDAADAIVRQILNGEPIDIAKAYEGAGNTFLATIFTGENLVQTATRVRANLANKSKSEQATPEATTGEVAPQTTPSATQNQVNTEQGQTTQSQSDPLSVQGEGELYKQYRDLMEQLNTGAITESEFKQRSEEVKAKFNQERVNPTTGEITVTNTFDEKKVYQPLGEQNENRNDNNDGTEDANGAITEPGVDELNAGGTQRSSEISEPVSPTETEATTTGNSQSDTQSVEDTVEQPNDNTAEGSTTGVSGRTGETVGSGLEQGELGAEGSQQNSEPTETSQSGSENSGVQQRTESDSSGETLIDPVVPDGLEDHPTSFKSKDEMVRYIRDLYKTDQSGAMQLMDELTSEKSQLKLRGIKASVKTKNSIRNDFYKDIRDGRAKTQQDLDKEQSAKKQQIEDLIKRGNPIGFMDENLGLFTTAEKKALAEELKGKIHSEQLSKLGLDLSPSKRLVNDYSLGANAKERLSTLKKGLTDQAWGKLSVEDRNKIINRLNRGPSADRSLSMKYVEFMVQNRLDGEAEFKSGLYAKAMEKHSKKADTTKRFIADQVSDVTSSSIGGKRSNQKPVKLKEGHQQLAVPLDIVKDDNEWVKGSNVLQSEGSYILDDGKFWSAKDISRTMTKPSQVVGVNPLQSFGLDLVGDVQPKSEKTLAKEAEAKKVAEEKAAKMKADAGQVVAALRGDKDKLKQAVERNNDKLRRMNEATAEPKLKYADAFKGSDLRQNQKVANSLIKENPTEIEQIREAFMGATPTARPSSFEAAKRGYVKFSVNNPNHKSFKGSKVDLEGFDFDGNPVYKRENDFLDELEDQHTVDSQTTLTLAAQPTTASKVQEQAVRQFFKDPTNRKVENEMREAVEEFAKEHDILEDDGSTLQGIDENLTTFANRQDFIAWVGDKLRPFFKKLNQLVAGVIAVVSVGAMTVPNDAVAHQGYATYTQGETIQGVSTEASNTINWVKQSKDHQGKNFVVADKDAGTIHIVSPEGKVLNTQHAIYGKGKGNDRSAMNTPSGRMQLQKATDLNATEKGLYGDSVLDLVDPTTKSKVRQTDGKIVAMHRVINKPERKAALQTATANDNYLSHGCINIPTAFYDSAVDSLDGAMVYVLDHKKPAKQAAKAKSSPTVGGSGLLNYKPKKLFSTSAFKNGDTLPNGLTKAKASKHLQKALGEYADNIFLVSREDYKIPNGGAERLIANGVEGFYHADTGAVVILADSIQAQDGLSVEERLAWVSWHELYHRGFDVKFGNGLSAILNQADGNAFIAELASAIQDDRAENNLTEVTREKAVEEALAELGAAIATGKLDALTKRYGLTVPNTFTQEDSFLAKLWDSLKQLYRKITGNKALTDRQVKSLLEEAITSAQPEKIEREMADELLAAYADDNNPMAVSAMFSVSKNLGRLGEKIRQNEQVQSIIDLMSNNDAGNTGHSPNTDQTKSSTVRRKGKQTVHDWVFERIQDSRIKLGRVDEQGEGGKLYRSVANMSNRTQQKVRQMEKKFKNLEYAMMQFADTHRNIFKKASDKKQVDVIVQDVTTALRALTGGNEVIRKHLQEALGGKDYFDEHGNLEHHEPGLIERVENYRIMINNRAEMGLPHSSYMTRELERLTRQLNDTLAIQAKFDASNDIILQPNADKNERKDWHGHNGFTLAEAHAKLKLYADKGLIDKDVLEGLEPETYEVKQYTGKVNEDGSLEFVVVQHHTYNAEAVEKNFTGEIKALVDQYAEVSKDLHNYTVDQLGERIAGTKKTAKWETSTMGKVREIYTTNEVDKDGNPIAHQYVIENPNSIDEIVTLQKVAEYSGHRTGRAFTGGSALEQLAWRTQMTAMQSSAKEVGQEMYDMYERGKTDDIRVYNIGDKDYALQKGIVLEVPDKANNGKTQYNSDGSIKTKVVKVSFKDNELNAALFGDNIKGGANSREISTAGLLLRMLPMAASKLTKFASLGLTSSLGFGLPNAYKGLKEKHNQLLAWTKDNAWVKSLPADKQALFDGVGGNTKLHGMLIAHTTKNGLARFKAREFASIAFATKLINKQDLYKTNLTGSDLEEYNKLLAIYERGGISSRVEDLLASAHNKKLQFAMGGKANKHLGYAMSVLENVSLVTMSQELVSTLMMTDFLENNLDMDAQMAADANLHFMNFDKRGSFALANYLRKYTMFANAIAQGSRAFVRSYFEVDKEGKLHFSKQGGYRLVRNTAIGVITHSLAMMIAEHKCPEKSGSMNQVGDLNPYQLMREIPISSGCDSYWRFPVEYGAGMVENMLGVSLVQTFRGNWSPAQAGWAIVDTLKDNASPLGLPIGETDNIFGSVLLNLIYPFTPEPIRDWTLAFGGIDDFGNPINSKWAGSKEYKPTAGKLTTDEAWFGMAESLYQKGFNVTPEEARAAVLGPFEGIPRQLLTWFIEKDPKVSAYDAILGTKSVYREGKDKATVAYTVVMNNLEHRYRDLHSYYIQAQGRDKTNPTDKWLADNGIELDVDEKKVLEFITEYRTRMKKTKLSQEQRYEINMDFLRKLKTVTHPEG